MPIIASRKRSTGRKSPRRASSTSSVRKSCPIRRPPKPLTSHPKLDALLAKLKTEGKPLSHFRPGTTVHTIDRMAPKGHKSSYSYRLEAPAGKRFAPDFRPEISPAQALAAGVFEGKYLNDLVSEVPREWFLAAIRNGTLSPDRADPSVNLLRVKSRLSLREWQRNHWIHDPDWRGWFQWAVRYWLGRRIPKLDELQIKRWKSFVARHKGQILADYRNRRSVDKCTHRAKQRQGLLQWLADPWT